MKKINLNNSDNTRDLGGYKTLDNKETKYNIFIRSDLITNLNNSEVNYFLKNNIKTIIDFRSDEEIIKKTSYFANDNRFSYNRVILFGRDAPSKEKDIPYSYMNILDDKKSMKKVIDIILNTSNGILFHCNMGKDRTGVISMILLLVANISPEVIIKDYALSDIYLKRIIDEYHEKNPNIPKFIGHAKEKYMKKNLELFFNKYENITNYFIYLGFNQKDIDKIKQRFL